MKMSRRSVPRADLRRVSGSGIRTVNRLRAAAEAAEQRRKYTNSSPSSPSAPPLTRGEPGELHEVWWTNGSELAMRARFRLLADALRFIWGNGREDAAWVKLKDGRWLHARALEDAATRLDGPTSPHRASRPGTDRASRPSARRNSWTGSGDDS